MNIGISLCDVKVLGSWFVVCGYSSRACSRAYAPFSKYPPMKVLLMTLQNAPRGLDYEGDKKFSKVDQLGLDKREASDMTVHNSNLQMDGDDQDSSTVIIGYCPDMFPAFKIASELPSGTNSNFDEHWPMASKVTCGHISILISWKNCPNTRDASGNGEKPTQHIDGGGANVRLHSAGLSLASTTNGDSLNTLTCKTAQTLSTIVFASQGSINRRAHQATRLSFRAVGSLQSYYGSQIVLN
ncbi:hypothetical protein Tco_1429220 [Tanacetum coccineum]